MQRDRERERQSESVRVYVCEYECVNVAANVGNDIVERKGEKASV